MGIMRTLLIVLLVIIAVRLLRRLLAPPRTSEDRGTHSIEGEEMVRDPACGKYLPRRGALSERVDGEALHFCSDACREAFARGVRASP